MALQKLMGFDQQPYDFTIFLPHINGQKVSNLGVMRYVQKLNENPDQVSQADVDVVYQADWDKQALCQTALVCAFFNFMNRWVDDRGIEADLNMVKMAGEHLYKKGYKGVNDLLEQKS